MATVDASTKESGMNYEEMSDLQINLLVANAIGVYAAENSGVVFASVKHEGDNVVSVIGAVDYCNNPSDAWPIINANLIGVIPDEDGVTMHFYGDWVATAFCSTISYTHKNPLRAAMIVFLMMKDAQNV